MKYSCLILRLSSSTICLCIHDSAYLNRDYRGPPLNHTQVREAKKEVVEAVLINPCTRICYQGHAWALNELEDSPLEPLNPHTGLR